MTEKQFEIFQDTKLAFSYLSDQELLRSYWLFRVLSVRGLSRVGPKIVELGLKLCLPLNWAIRPTIFKHFCAGEDLESCLPLIHKFYERKVESILDFASERNSQEHEFQACEDEIIRSIDFAAKKPEIAFVVFKTTAMGNVKMLEACSSKTEMSPQDLKDRDALEERVTRVCKRAFDKQVRIFIDAEESWIQGHIDELAEKMMKRFNSGKKTVVYTTVQMYRTDRLGYLGSLVNQAKKDGFKLGLKLVRGAYMEKERERAQSLGQKCPIHPNKASTDRDYNLALRLAADSMDVVSLCVGTHNEVSTLLAMELIHAKIKNSQDERLFFSQLLGMSDHLSFNLAHAGFRVAKYMPYGPIRAVLPYLFRRAEENSSVHEQSQKQLKLFETELKRRQLSV